MAKPIFVVKVQNQLWNQDKIAGMFEDIQTKLSDYHVLMLPSRSEKETFLECYNVTDVEPTTLANIQNTIFSELGIKLKIDEEE